MHVWGGPGSSIACTETFKIYCAFFWHYLYSVVRIPYLNPQLLGNETFLNISGNFKLTVALYYEVTEDIRVGGGVWKALGIYEYRYHLQNTHQHLIHKVHLPHSWSKSSLLASFFSSPSIVSALPLWLSSLNGRFLWLPYVFVLSIKLKETN
jgi:hypothetical protein